VNGKRPYGFVSGMLSVKAPAGSTSTVPCTGHRPTCSCAANEKRLRYRFPIDHVNDFLLNTLTQTSMHLEMNEEGAVVAPGKGCDSGGADRERPLCNIIHFPRIAAKVTRDNE
jgi:hypothetical protein